MNNVSYVTTYQARLGLIGISVCFCSFFFFLFSLSSFLLSSFHLFSLSFLFRPLLQFSVRVMSLHPLLCYSELAINKTKGFQFRRLCYTEITEPARLLTMLFFPLSIHLASTCQIFLDPSRTSIADACLTTLAQLVKALNKSMIRGFLILPGHNSVWLKLWSSHERQGEVFMDPEVPDRARRSLPKGRTSVRLS